jgi:hypothetical protein
MSLSWYVNALPPVSGEHGGWKGFVVVAIFVNAGLKQDLIYLYTNTNKLNFDSSLVAQSKSTEYNVAEIT